MLVPPQSIQSSIEEISDLVDNVFINAYVELTLRILTSVPTLPSGPPRSWAIHKTVAHFIAEYGSTTSTDNASQILDDGLLERRRFLRQDAGPGSLPRAIRDRHMPLDRDPHQVRWGLSGDNLYLLPYRVIN